MQKSKLPSLITTLILTLITALMWIGFTIYRAITTAPEPSVPTAVSATFTPILDTDTLNKIKSGLFFEGSQIPPLSFSASPTPTVPLIPKPTPLPLSTPVGSPSASPSGTPTATP